MNDKYLISADWQIGMKPENVLELQNDFTEAATWIAQRAKEEVNCKGLILPGDIRDTKAIEPNQFELLQIFNQTGGKPVGCIMGNHDYTSPNWIDILAESNPTVKNLTNAEKLSEMGLDPTTCIGLDYKPASEIDDVFKTHLKEGKRTFFIHQSLGEFGANMFSDITTRRIEKHAKELDITDPILIFAGDIHNYGDYTVNNVTSFSPGSIQATDINEGYRKLQSHKFEHNPKDYRKFILWWYPATNTVEREEIPYTVLRPWYYDQFNEGTKRVPELFQILIDEWKKYKKGRIVIKVPTQEVTATQELAQKLQEDNGFPFQKFKILSISEKNLNPHGETEEFKLTQSKVIDRKAWVREGILKLAKQDPKLEENAINLLKEITDKPDASKISVETSYKDWKKTL